MYSYYNHYPNCPPITLIICIPQEKKYIINHKKFKQINKLFNYIRNNP